MLAAEANAYVFGMELMVKLIDADVNTTRVVWTESVNVYVYDTTSLIYRVVCTTALPAVNGWLVTLDPKELPAFDIL